MRLLDMDLKLQPMFYLGYRMLFHMKSKNVIPEAHLNMESKVVHIKTDLVKCVTIINPFSRWYLTATFIELFAISDHITIKYCNR